MNLDTEIQKLNPMQRAAVETIDGPVLVIAGPGTGKTQMLALRIANILKSTDINPSNILCLTFTESGVNAMRERLIKMIDSAAYYVKIHTFHSFSNEIILNNPEKFSFTKDLKQIDDLGRIKLIREILDNAELDKLKPFYNPYFYQNAIISTIQTLKHEDVSYETFQEKVQAEIENHQANPQINKRTNKPTVAWNNMLESLNKLLEFGKVYQLYQESIKEKGFYDYEDMILFVIKQFKEDDQLLAFYQEKFLYILVDEYQDTNGSQNEILKLMGNFDASPNIFAVGDDDQAIYRFQGANVENILSFTTTFSNVKAISVDLNYRSTQSILDFSSNSIQNNGLRISNLNKDLNKNLKSGLNKSGNKPLVYEFKNSIEEYDFLVKKINELVLSGVEYSDIAVLYRKNDEALELIDKLDKANIPFNLTTGKNILDEKIIQNIVKLLKILDIQNQDPDYSLAEILLFDFFDINKIDAYKIVRFYSEQKRKRRDVEVHEYSLLEIISSEEVLKRIEVQDSEKVLNLGIKLLEWRDNLINLNFYEALIKILNESNLIYEIIEDQGDLEKLNIVKGFLNFAKQQTKLNPDIKVNEFLEDLRLFKENNIQIIEKEANVTKGAVNLMTAHRSKGLEFEHVFIINFYDGNWGGRSVPKLLSVPDFVFGTESTIDKIDKKILELEDERRLFFVAATRAKTQLFITYSKKYSFEEDAKVHIESQFLAEIDKNLYEFTRIESTEEKVEDLLKDSLKYQPKDIDDKEKDYLKNLTRDLKVSFSLINSYIECPLKFKFEKLLKVPLPKSPALILGNSIHFALEHFYKNLIKGEAKDSNYLSSMANLYLRGEYLSDQEFKDLTEESKKLLDEYYKFYAGSFVKPIEVEYGVFGHDVILKSDITEDIILTGKIDKIEWLNKDLNEVKVVDYKTSTPKSENHIKGKTKDSTGDYFRQLLFYKLLGDSDEFFKPSPNSPKYKITQGEIDFIKPEGPGKFKKVTIQLEEDDLQILKNQIVEIVVAIRNLEFGTNPKYPNCDDCDYCKSLVP